MDFPKYHKGFHLCDTTLIDILNVIIMAMPLCLKLNMRIYIFLKYILVSSSQLIYLFF